MEWHYTLSDGSPAGPSSPDDVIRYLKSLTDASNVHVWTSGMQAWVAAKDVDIFAPHIELQRTGINRNDEAAAPPPQSSLPSVSGALSPTTPKAVTERPQPRINFPSLVVLVAAGWCFFLSVTMALGALTLLSLGGQVRLALVFQSIVLFWIGRGVVYGSRSALLAFFVCHGILALVYIGLALFSIVTEEMSTELIADAGSSILFGLIVAAAAYFFTRSSYMSLEHDRRRIRRSDAIRDKDERKKSEFAAMEEEERKRIEEGKKKQTSK